MAESAHFLDPEFRIDTSHLITEDDEPLDNPFQERQQAILTDGLYTSWKGRDRFVALKNVGVFVSPQQPPVVPDVLLTLDVDLMPAETSRAYFVWEYGKPPDLVIEVVSKEPGGEGVGKLQEYAALGVPYYIVYNPFGFRGERVLKAFQRYGMGYLDLANPGYIPELGLGVTIWDGNYQGCPGKYLRFVDQAGQLLLTGQEQAEQHQRMAEAAQARAEAAQARAEEAQAKAEEAQDRAEQERVRAERLERRLREAGLEP